MTTVRKATRKPTEKILTDGVALIAAERQRQISGERYSSAHDDKHTDGSIAMAAACYAAPERIYTQDARFVNQVVYSEPFPWSWDKRYSYGDNRKNSSNALPDPDTFTDEERIDLLVKAGALIAAEIERLQRRSVSCLKKRKART